MPAIRDFGKGRVLTQNPTQLAPGEARDSLNLLHNHGAKTARLRKPIKRINLSSFGGRVCLGLHEYVKANGNTLLMSKWDDTLATFSAMSQSTGASTVMSGMDSTHLIQMATASGFVFIADWAVKNYISDGTTGGTYELQKTISAGGFTLANHGAAVGNAAATIRYWVSDVDPATGAESPPSAAVSVSRNADAGVRLTNTALDFTAPWTKKNIYRDKAGLATPYLVASLVDASNFPYDDATLDTDLTTLSEIHDDAGAASIEKPEAAKHVVFHRGRLFWANLNGHPSRLRWSRPLEPTQYSSGTQSRWDVAADDGQEITGLVSFRGALVIFKTNSIYVMNGDVDENTFTVFPAVVGNGCVAPRSIAVWPDAGIFFLGRCGVFLFDLNNAQPASTAILPDLDRLDPAYRDFYTAGIDPCNRLYMLSARPLGQTQNFQSVTHVLNIDTGAWGRFEYAAGFVCPNSYSPSSDNGQVRNDAHTVKAFFGDQYGFLYETDVTLTASNNYPQGDGMVPGQTNLVPVSGTATTTTFTTASGIYAGATSKNIDLSLTIVRAADGSIESRVITAQATSGGNQVLSHAAWTGAAATTTDLCFIGAYAGYLVLGRTDLDSTRRKRWKRLSLEFEKSVSSVNASFGPYTAAQLLQQQIPLWVGFVKDADALPMTDVSGTNPHQYENFTPPAGAKAISTYSGMKDRVTIDKRSVSISPFFFTIGTGHSFELLLLEIDGYPLGSTVSPA